MVSHLSWGRMRAEAELVVAVEPDKGVERRIAIKALGPPWADAARPDAPVWTLETDEVRKEPSALAS